MMMLPRLVRGLCNGFMACFLTLHGHAAMAVISGELSNPGNWPAMLLLTNPSGSLCTATVVGERSILTAGQCVRAAADNGGRRAYVRVGSATYELNCEALPARNGELNPLNPADIALCLADSALPIAPERIDTGAVSKLPGTKVVVVGLGCRLPDAIDRTIGLLRTGQATIDDPLSMRFLSFPRISDPRATLTISGAALCPGDAGGGTFLVQRDGSRVLLGVNTLSDLKRKSWISLTSSIDFLDWAKAWSARRNTVICGLVGESGCVAARAPKPPDNVELAAPSPQRSTALNAEARLAAVTGLSGFPAQVSAPAGPGITRTLTVFARKGEKLKETVQRVCGQVGEEYLAELRALLVLEGSSDLLDSSMVEGREVQIPSCPIRLVRPSEDQDYNEVEVKQGDTAYGYFRASLKGTGAKAIWRDFDAPANVPAETVGEYFLAAFRGLNPGLDTDNMPIGIRVRIPRHPAALIPDAAVALAPGEIKPIFALQSSETRCVAPPDSRRYPFDLGLLLDVLAANRAIDNRARVPVPVVIADSGLFGARSGVFRDAMLANTDDWNQFTHNVTPLNLGSEPEHGTEVATLALGGPMFARLQAVTGPRIQLAVRRIYSKSSGGGQSWYDVDKEFVDIIQRASRSYPGIVNLSLKTDTQMDWMKVLVASDASPALFVAAAGNFDGLLGPTANKFVYPAVYGGPGSPSLLVVAGLDGAGALADFSNSGPEFVEIAAPGCLVPTFDFDTETRHWVERRLSGTSMATPLVSFAAALTKSERVGGGWVGADIKRRLLVSADLHNGELAKSIADGRVLNIVKAVAIYEDVVELRGSEQLLFGSLSLVQSGKRLAEQHVLNLKCNDNPISLKVSDIFKLVPNWNPGASDRQMKVYYRAPGNSLFFSTTCEVPPDLEVTFQDQLSDAIHSYTLDQISDITRRSN